MSFVKNWAPYFQSAARMRGRAFQSSGRVTQLSPQNGETVRAEVRDSETQTVTITGDGPNANVNCTCKTFAEGRYCEHIWATLLEVQYNGIKADESEGGGGDEASPTGGAADLAGASPGLPKARKRSSGPRPAEKREPAWMSRLALLRPLGSVQFGPPARQRDTRTLLGEQQDLCYVVNPELSIRHQGLVIEFRNRMESRRGRRRFKRISMSREAATRLPNPVDRELCALVLGSAWVEDSGFGERVIEGRPRDAFRLPAGGWRALLKRMIATGRAYIDLDDEQPAPLAWDGEEPWVLWAAGRLDEDDALLIQVELRRGKAGAETVVPVDEPEMLLGGADGLVFFEDRAAPLDDRDAFRWAGLFRDEMRLHGDAAPLRIAPDEIDQFLDRLYRLPELPPMELPPGIGRHERPVEPTPRMALHSPEGNTSNRSTLTGRVWFTYEQYEVTPEQSGRYIVPGEHPAAPDEHAADTDASAEDPAGPAALIRRDLRFERDAIASLAKLGFKANPTDGPDALTLRANLMPRAVAELTREGWVVTADQHLLRTASSPKLSVRSGIDWFELHGQVTFQTETGEQTVDLPDILRAARQGKSMITLGDGTQGMLPAEWLAEHGLLAAIGSLEDDHVRYKSSQAALLDALLAAQPVDVDARFANAREQVRNFDKVEPLRETESFQGTLRAYQREGLGWIDFLRRFGMGGVLADDMGLGKTIQVLASLVARYRDADSGSGSRVPDSGDVAGANEQSEPSTEPGTGNPEPDSHRPTLVVAPRSVVFNWLDEAERFAPDLRVGNYTGPTRHELRANLHEHDLIVTSYGLMRRDIAELSELRFDYVILDEAQAIKNPNSLAAKAARLLKCEHRLALTGTPVENHLGDLWSIFEFLNPGMLGSGARFAKWLRGAQKRGRPAKDEAPRGQLGGRAMQTDVDVARQAGQAVRPFILRRTKGQVLSELPDKIEQTIVCTMPAAQRKVYDELLKHYRDSLLRKLKPGGAAGASAMGESSMLVIEALLRLRQAACHPALIDPKRADAPSAKLDALTVHLEELIDEGHKALVFSQFTSMLSLVKKRLDERGITYEYLDGQTRDRKTPVEHFQTDANCPVFLISLKAGGLGLNLTAADYVFILDPWWNPAVEQQAIDRAHRIGQTRHVFAYRLICENTVEQRIAELQARKRDLADAIVGGQDNLLRSLTREDLELLLT